MTDVYIICEGLTELRFVKNVLAPGFGSQELFLRPVRIGSQNRKGGNVTFGRLFTNIRDQLYNSRKSYCSTLFDFYGLPPGFPGVKEATTRSRLSEKASAVYASLETALGRDIASEPLQRFIPYVQMHEFEALLFSDPFLLAVAIGQPELHKDFTQIRAAFQTPEHIDDGPFSAPSKRILSLVSAYEKPLIGETAAKAIGLNTIRQQCPLFDAWLTKLENLPPLQP